MPKPTPEKSRITNNAGANLIGHSLVDEHLRRGSTLLLLRRRVHSMGPRVDGKAVNLRLDRDILQLREVRRVLHVEYGDGPAGARDVDPAQTRGKHHHART